MVEKKKPNFHGIVMNRLITLRDKLRSTPGSEIFAEHLDNSIKMIHVNLANK